MGTVLKNVFGWIFLVVIVVAFFMTAGRWDWAAGWATILLITVGYSFQGLYVASRDRELMRRREQLGEGTKTWDKICLVFFFFSFLAILFVGALDSGRHRWSAMPWWLWFLGAALFLFHIWIITWSMLVNTYFEKTVRIQADRDHRVIDTGPYRVVRHPGYASILIGGIAGLPLLLYSWWVKRHAGMDA